MARPYWKGSISFGLVNVPVALYPAVRKKDVRFHLYHDADGGRIREKRVCTLDDREVPGSTWSGYELSKGQVVTISQEEQGRRPRRATGPSSSRSSSSLDKADVMLHEQSYWVALSPGGKGLRLAGAGAKKTDDVAVARIVLSTKQHPARCERRGRLCSPR
jgi:DNA end-binding protein Ku